MLFERNDDIFKNAYPNWQKNFRSYNELFIIYAEHYKQAGDSLIISIGNNRGHNADSIINPSIFLYRHSIELCLKAILFQNYIDLGKDTEKIKEKLNGHCLKSLWNRVRNEICNNYRFINNKKDKDELNKIERLITELHDVDNKSMNYRYPFDLDLQEYIYGDGKESYGIDYLNFKEEINYLYNRLYYWLYYNIIDNDEE
ncbi:hypothetical protein GLW20_08200 [Virgibacillus halodenitrificans]|nr:hypothetical protein [Virgibacillus halodenitrificans]